MKKQKTENEKPINEQLERVEQRLNQIEQIQDANTQALQKLEQKTDQRFKAIANLFTQLKKILKTMNGGD